MQPVTQITVFYLDHRYDGTQHLFVDGQYSFSEEIHMHEKLEGIRDFLDTKKFPYTVNEILLEPKTEKVRDNLCEFYPEEGESALSFQTMLLKSFNEYVDKRKQSKI